MVPRPSESWSLRSLQERVTTLRNAMPLSSDVPNIIVFPYLNIMLTVLSRKKLLAVSCLKLTYWTTEV